MIPGCITADAYGSYVLYELEFFLRGIHLPLLG
jgi:hypothetical protein